MPVYTRVRKDGEIMLPLDILREARIKEGDRLEVLVEEDGSLRLLPKPSMRQALVEEQQRADLQWVLRMKGKSHE